jgi:hypothetical protein
LRPTDSPEPREPNLGYAIIVDPLSEIGPQNDSFLYGTIIQVVRFHRADRTFLDRLFVLASRERRSFVFSETRKTWMN